MKASPPIDASRRRIRIGPHWGVSFWAPLIVFGVLAVLAALAAAVKQEAKVVAEGRLIEYLPDSVVKRVELFDLSVYVDASISRTDILTAVGLSALAGVALASAALLRGWTHGSRRTSLAFALLGLGALTAALDEAFSVHETIGLNLPFLRELPLVDHPDDALMAFYAVCALAFGWYFRDVLLRFKGARDLMAAGVGLFVLALVIDMLPTEALGSAEELLEMLAAVCLAAGLVALSGGHVPAALARENAGLFRVDASPAPHAADRHLEPAGRAA